jgi:hypothetical protein
MMKSHDWLKLNINKKVRTGSGVVVEGVDRADV